MHATAPSSKLAPHEGQRPDAGAAPAGTALYVADPRVPLPCSGAIGDRTDEDAAGAPEAGTAALGVVPIGVATIGMATMGEATIGVATIGVATRGLAGVADGTPNGLWHEGQRTVLPAALSGTCMDF